MRGPSLAFALVAAVAASLWWLQTPPRSADAYGDSAAKAAAAVASQTETARLWARVLAEGRTLSTSATVGLEDADRRAHHAVSSFLSEDPPPDATGVRETFDRVTGDATAALAELRIAAHHEDWERVEATQERLRSLAERLREFERAAER